MIIEEDNQFDLLPFSWTQSATTVTIQLPVPGLTFNNEAAVSFSNNEFRGHIVAQSDGEEGGVLMNIDVVNKINIEESTYKVEDDILVITLTKEHPDEWSALFFTQFTYDYEDERVTITSVNPPIAQELEEPWFTTTILDDFSVAHTKFLAAVAEFKDPVVGSITELVDVDGIDKTQSDKEELANAYYQKAMSLLNDDEVSISLVLDCFRCASSLGNALAKEKYITFLQRSLISMEQEAALIIYSSPNPQVVMEEITKKRDALKKEIADYTLSSALTSNHVPSILRYGAQAFDEGNLETAFIYLVEAALRGSNGAIQEIGHMYFVGSDTVPQNLDKALAWWSLALNRGAAPAAYNIGAVYTERDDLEVAYEYFELARSINPSLTVPNSYKQKLKKKEQENKNKDLDDFDTAIESALKAIDGSDEPIIESVEETETQITKQTGSSDFGQKSLSFDMFGDEGNLEDLEDLDNLESEPKEDKPGVSWVVSEWLLTSGVFLGIGYYLWNKVKVDVDN